MKRETINIRLDYLQGPIWISDIETGRPITGIDIIDNDEVIAAINREVSLLYSSFYCFDTKDGACIFDAAGERENKDRLLDLLSKLIKRLNDINDGSYVVNDEETPRISAL